MNSGDYPDGSRENPVIIPDTDYSDEAPLTDSASLESLSQAAEVFQNHELLGLQDRDEENLGKRRRRMSDFHGGFSAETSNDWERRWAADMATRQKEYRYEIAKSYASELHSDQIFKKEEEEAKGERSSQFQKARRGSISTTTSSGIELNLMIQWNAPTLIDMTLRVLSENSEAIKSLNLVPHHLKKKLSNLVSGLGKANTRFIQLLIQDSPSEVSVRNCVDLVEEDLTKILCDCDRFSLKVLNLDLCGRAMTENAITEFLKRSPNGFPSLTILSLQGSFCLTDNALALISRSSPLLRLINLSECSLLTFHAVKILAYYFGSTLRGLNIGGCQGIKPSNVFKSSLSKFRELNYLSVAGLESIHDVVVEFLTSRGSNLTDLSLASCYGVTDRTIWSIGRYCPNLEALDLSELDDLTDTALENISDGCRSLNSVKLTKNRFSDEAIAAFLEVSGGSLNHLCLNNVRDVGQDSAISLSKNCKRLRYLDLSWCRKLTEEDVKRILGCCSLLRSLKLYGWTQVKDEFLEELSRSQVHIIGLKMTSVFAHLDDSYPSVDANFF